MKFLILDLYPAYIPFIVQCTKGAGDKIDPTVDNLIIYEEGGADAAFDSTTITGSPFDPAQVNAKTGLWGVLIAKTAFTVGNFYIALWEMTVDGITTAKVERYFACNASQFKADVSALALESGGNLADVLDITGDILEDTGATLDAKINTIDSILDELKDLFIIKTGTVVDAAPSKTKFKTSLTEIDNYWNSGVLVWRAGSANIGNIRSIKDFANIWGEVTLNSGLEITPVNGDAFAIVLLRAFKLAGLEMQEIRDAMKLAPSAGEPATGSIDSGIAIIISYVQNVLNRIGDFAGSGLNTIFGYFGAVMRKDEGLLPDQVGGTYDNRTDSLEALRDNPGGSAGGSIVLPVLEGAVYSSLAVQNKEVNIVRGDTPTIFFDLHGDYTDWTAEFGAKVNPKDTEYVIAPISCTWTDPVKGQGFFELTSAETANEAKLVGEIALSKDTKHLTAIRFILRIIEDVIK